MKRTAVVVVALTSALVVAVTGSASGRLESGSMSVAGIPPKGDEATPFTTGRLLIALGPRENTTWNVYSDGLVIWQKWTSSGVATVVPPAARRVDTSFVQQRLTPQGLQLLRSKLLATGLFEQNLKLEVGNGRPWVFHQLWRGDRMVAVHGVPSADPSWNEHFTKATPAQTRALRSIENFVDDPARWLPAKAWADSRVRAVVPVRYLLVIDRGYPDLSKLPAPARRVLVQYKQLRSDACQIVTTGQARTLVQAFVEAGISPSENSAETIAFDFAGLHLPNPSYLHLHPALPSSHC